MNITFNFPLSSSVVQRDRRDKDVSQLSLKALAGLGYGRIFIYFKTQEKNIILDTWVVDYLLQIKGVIRHIDDGNLKTFAVSGDYYSNNIHFTYSPKTAMLTIYEANGGEFNIKTGHQEFRLTFLRFFSKATREIFALSGIGLQHIFS